MSSFEIKVDKRRSLFSELKPYCHHAEEGGFMALHNAINVEEVE